MEIINIYYLHYGDNIAIYVGRSKNIKVRLANHKRKFGKNVKIEIIDEVSEIEWMFWEKFYISLFKSWGFDLKNKNNGGGGPTTCIFSPERNIKIGLANKGRSLPTKGVPFSDEHKYKIKLTRSFLKERKSPWLYKPVIQYDMEWNYIKEWPSQIEAFKSFDRKSKGDGIGSCCRGEQPSAYGYKWKFK